MTEPKDLRQWRDEWLNRELTPTSTDPRRVPRDPALPRRQGSLVIAGGRVFDGTGAEARPATVVVRGNRISELLDPTSKDYPADARLVDASGMTVMPGLIDLHTHISYHEPEDSVDIAVSQSDTALRALERVRFYLESGITSIRDAGSLLDIPFRLKAWVAQDRMPGPRIFAAGQLITGTGGHGAESLTPVSARVGKVREASGPDDWRNAAREQFKNGADVIKIASHFSPQEVAAIVHEAHSLGLKVMCDAETFYIEWAVRAGVDVIEHPLPRSDETIALMAEMGTEAVPTLIPYIFIFQQRGGYFNSTSRRFTFSQEANREVVRRMRKAGVKIGVGTDLILDWFRYLPWAYIEELREYTHCGFTPQEALVAATKTSAEILDMGQDLGTLEAGKLADIILVEGEPDRNLDDLARIPVVIKDGLVLIESGKVITPPHQQRPLPWKD